MYLRKTVRMGMLLLCESNVCGATSIGGGRRQWRLATPPHGATGVFPIIFFSTQLRFQHRLNVSFWVHTRDGGEGFKWFFLTHVATSGSGPNICECGLCRGVSSLLNLRPAPTPLSGGNNLGGVGGGSAIVWKYSKNSLKTFEKREKGRNWSEVEKGEKQINFSAWRGFYWHLIHKLYKLYWHWKIAHQRQM